MWALAGFAGALHWLSYEPEPGTGILGVGITVAMLFETALAAAVLAERADRVPRLERRG